MQRGQIRGHTGTNPTITTHAPIGLQNYELWELDDAFKSGSSKQFSEGHLSKRVPMLLIFPIAVFVL